MNAAETATSRGSAARAWVVATCAVLALAVAAVYGRALHAPFIFDDTPGILENRSLEQLWPLVGDATARGPLNPPPLAPTARRPLANWTLAVDRHFHGLDPAGFRATNLALHALAAMLLAALVRRTLVLPYFGGVFAATAAPIALVTALVWAVHPLATEAVVYVTQRTELLAAFCYFFAFWAALRHWAASTPAAARGWTALAVASGFAGVASKEIVVSLPLAVALYERTFLADSWAALRRSRVLYGGLAASWLLLVVLSASGIGGLADARHSVAPLVWWVTQAKVALLYLKLAVWPWPLALHYAPDYLDSFAAAWPWVLASTIVAATTAVLVWRRPAARFLVVASVLVLAPTLVVPLPKMMAAERRMYLPLAGFVTLAVVAAARPLVARAPRGLPWPALTAAAGLVVMLGAVSAERLTAYATAVTIWEDTVRTQPRDAMAHYNLGVAVMEAGRPPAETMPHFEAALALDPDHTGALDNLGLALKREGRLDEARARFEAALRIEPTDAVAHNNLGAVLLDLHRPADAIPHLERALAAQPDRPKAKVHLNLGRALFETGRPDAALAELETAVRLAPDDGDVRFNLGSTLLALGRPADAIPAFEAALRLAPDDVAAESNLASALLQTGDTARAIGILERIVTAHPGDVNARNNLGIAFLALGRAPDAIAAFTQVLAREPGHATAHYNLGSALLDAGRPAEAIPHFEAALARDPGDPYARFKLAIATAHTGRIDAALTLAADARAAARARRNDALATEIDTWLGGYRAAVRE